MKRLNLILMLAACCFACQQPQQDRQAEEAAIKALHETFADAWNNADGGWKFVDARPYQLMMPPAMEMSEK
ncbi:MAG: hypothetical protein ACE5I1_23715 [bacterium]